MQRCRDHCRPGQLKSSSEQSTSLFSWGKYQTRPLRQLYPPTITWTAFYGSNYDFLHVITMKKERRSRDGSRPCKLLKKWLTYKTIILYLGGPWSVTRSIIPIHWLTLSMLITSLPSKEQPSKFLLSVLNGIIILSRTASNRTVCISSKAQKEERETRNPHWMLM